MPRIPTYLYRYLSYGEYLREVILGHRVRVKSRVSLNDPCDCLVEFDLENISQSDWRSFFDQMFQRIEPHWAKRRALITKSMAAGHYKDPKALNSRRKEVQENVDRCGVLSLSESPDNPLLWAHYAQGHRGVCLRFVTREFHHALKATSASLCVPHPVKYRVRVPLRPVGQTAIQHVEETFLTKTTDWAYEREWRVLLTDLLSEGQQFADVSFEPHLLAGLILGSQMTSEAKTRVTGWCRERKPILPVFQARLVNGSVVVENDEGI